MITKLNDDLGLSQKSASSGDGPTRIGLLAGWGRLPVVVAQRLQESGHHVYCLGFHGHADLTLRDICHHYRAVGVARLGTQIRYFKRHGVHQATMVGKLHKTLLFRKLVWLRHLPDLTFWRYYYRHFLTASANRNDDALLTTATEMFDRYGIHFVPATNFAPELLVKQGQLTQRSLTEHQKRDVEFGWQIAKQMGNLDVGQCVVVKGRAVLAIEAVEGTDDCIRRAGELCPAGGFTVIKVSKPQQDMRFDVPTVGVGTLKTIKDSGGSVLAVEAKKTIALDQDELISYANRHNIALVSVDPDSAEQFAA